MNSIRPATLADVTRIQLREADVLEIEACGIYPEYQLTVLSQCIRCSTLSFAGDYNGEVGCLFGVQDQHDGRAEVWMFGSDLVAAYPLQFLRQGRAWVERMQSLFPTLECHAYSGNELHLQWLEWLGFEVVTESDLYGTGATFITYQRTTPCAES